MTDVTTTELAGVEGGQCYTFSLKQFGLELAIHIGSCDMQ